MIKSGPPPQKTGDIVRDYERLHNWCQRLYQELVRLNNYERGGSQNGN